MKMQKQFLTVIALCAPDGFLMRGRATAEYFPLSSA